MLQAWHRSPRTHLPHDRFFPLAARVIMVHVDKLTHLERLVTHAAGVLLRIQQGVELLRVCGRWLLLWLLVWLLGSAAI
jgi:hypothetical protein